MFYIVETENQLLELQEKDTEVYCELITSSDVLHPKLSSLIGVYIRPLSGKKGYIIPIDHSDGLNINVQRVRTLLLSYNKVYVKDKKYFFYFIILNNLIDIRLLISNNTYQSINLPDLTSITKNYYYKYSEYKEVNKILPLTKLYEQCENNYEYLKQFFQLPLNDGFKFYNDIVTKVFYLIEQGGLKVVYTPFIELFKPTNPIYNIDNNIVYTYYNLTNTTGRPTNSFNGINFNGIPHKEEYRKSIIPKNDSFIELDFDGYHLRLISDQLNVTLTQEKVHTQIGKIFYNKEELTEEEYQKVKQKNFQSLYGNIPKEYSHILVFQEVQKYIDSLWGQYRERGSVNSPLSLKEFNTNLQDMNPQKLFNYVVQNLETSRNVLILKEVLNYLKDKKSDICLYTYDSILIDFNKKDGENILNDIENIVSEGNKYPVSFKESKNLVL